MAVMPHVVAAPDKFRGTATAAEIAAAVASAAASCGWTCDSVPVADGGEGLLDVLAVLGGATRRSVVRGPLGRPVEAEWRLIGRMAVIEMARASGLTVAGGPAGNDCMKASTTGTGQLIAAAINAGAKRVIVGLGGSATTDGGQGALRALEPHSRLRGVELTVACDVTTAFVDAAVEFAPQKGASSAQVALLTRRLQRLAQLYLEQTGVDVRSLPGAGAAGGLAGGLATVGAQLVPGFEIVSELLGLAERIEAADLVVTGEGCLDEWSFRGKTVGGVVGLAREVGVPVLAVVGAVADSDAEVKGDEASGDEAGNGRGRPWGGAWGDAWRDAVEVVELRVRFGADRSWRDPAGCVADVVVDSLRTRGERGGTGGAVSPDVL